MFSQSKHEIPIHWAIRKLLFFKWKNNEEQIFISDSSGNMCNIQNRDIFRDIYLMHHFSIAVRLVPVAAGN